MGQCLTVAYSKFSPDKSPNFFDIFKKLHNPNSINQVNQIFNLALGLVSVNFLELFLSVIATHLFFMYRKQNSQKKNLSPEKGESKSTFVSKRNTESLRKLNIPIN